VCLVVGGGKSDGFSDLFEESGSILHAQALSHTVPVVLVHLVEQTHHVITDVLSAGTQRLTDVVDQILAFILIQHIFVKVPNLSILIGRVDEFISTGKSLSACETGAVIVVCSRAHIHRVLIVCHLLLLVLVDIHEAILLEVVDMEGAVDGYLIMIHTKSVHLCVLI